MPMLCDAFCRTNLDANDLHTISSTSMEKIDWRRGYAWKAGKLYAFEAKQIVVMRMWPDMLAWRRTRKKSWASTRRHADDLLRCAPFEIGVLERHLLLRKQFGGPLVERDCYDVFKLNAAPVLAALATIPERERRIAARFKDRRWHVLALMARCQGAADLLESNPALGFALANSWVLKDPSPTQPMRAARGLIKRPQVEIMQWLGFPPTKRVRRILSRIEPEALAGRKLPSLQRALWSSAIQETLVNLPGITSDVMSFICDPDVSDRVTHRFLFDLLQRETVVGSSGCMAPPFYYSHWRDACWNAKSLDRAQLPMLRSIAQLEKWHGELAEAYARERDAQRAREVDGQRVYFCTPPFAGTSAVEPILDSDSLLEEGRCMGHCVASYRHAVEAGRYFVYRVTSPVRATLGLRQDAGLWAIDQIRGFENRRVTPQHCDEILAKLGWSIK